MSYYDKELNSKKNQVNKNNYAIWATKLLLASLGAIILVGFVL